MLNALGKFFLCVAMFAATVSAAAAEYTVRQKEGKAGACFNNKKRLTRGGGRFCHNCLNGGGNRIEWRFVVYCDSMRTEKEITVGLKCRRKKIPEEGEQLRKLYEEAENVMDEHLHLLHGWRDCNLGGWPE